MEVDPALVHQDSEVGQSYLAGVKLGGLYAYAGREWVVERVRRIIGGQITDSVHNHHNFVWRESHGGRDYWVVRKGATPAFPGQRGFVGGSMGDNAVILHGVDSPESADSLYSTVHGAGRLFGRMEAKGKKNKAGQWVRPPRFTRDEMDAWLREKGILLRGGDVDESPMVYRRLEDVLAYHRGTIEIEHTLTALRRRHGRPRRVRSLQGLTSGQNGPVVIETSRNRAPRGSETGCPRTRRAASSARIDSPPWHEHRTIWASCSEISKKSTASPNVSLSSPACRRTGSE